MIKLNPMIPGGGACGVCGKATLLLFHCPATNICIGQCCHADMITADRLIELNMANGGPIHPAPGQFPPLSSADH